MDEVARNSADTDAYLYIAAAGSRLSYEEMPDRSIWELFRTRSGGTITKDVLCPYRGITDYR